MPNPSGAREKSRAPCCCSEVVVVVEVVVVDLLSIKLLNYGRVLVDLLHVSLGLLLQRLCLLLELDSQLVHVDVRVSPDGLQPGNGCTQAESAWSPSTGPVDSRGSSRGHSLALELLGLEAELLRGAAYLALLVLPHARGLLLGDLERRERL